MVDSALKLVQGFTSLVGGGCKDCGLGLMLGATGFAENQRDSGEAERDADLPFT